MSSSVAKARVASGLFVFCCIFLLYHRANTPVAVSRPIPLFQEHSSTSRNIPLRKDFASFYYAGKAVATQKNLYDTYSLNTLAERDGVRNGILPYLYPPFFAVVAQPLAVLPPADAQVVWDYLQIFVASLTCVVVFLTLSGHGFPQNKSFALVMRGMVLAVLMVVLPFRGNLDFGQMNILVVFLLSMSFYVSYERKLDWVAGVFLALATLLKVTPGLFIIFFLVTKRWKILAGFFGGIILFLIVSLVIAGSDPWLQFLRFLPSMGYAKTVDGGFLPNVISNFSLAGFLMRVFVGEAKLVRLLSMSGAVVLFATLLYHHIQFGRQRNEALFILPYLILLLIISPVTWFLHLVYLLPGILFLWDLWFTSKGAGFLFSLAAILLGLAIVDYQPVYSGLHVSEDVRPFVTSLNLFFLLGLFLLSFLLLRKQGSLFVRR